MIKPGARCKAESFIGAGVLQIAAVLSLAFFFSLTVSAGPTSDLTAVSGSDAAANAKEVDGPRILAEDLAVASEPILRQERRVLVGMHGKGKGMHGRGKGMHKGMVGMHWNRRQRQRGPARQPPSGLLSFDDFDVDYGRERVNVWGDGTIQLKLTQGGGVRLRSKARYQYGTFSFDVKSPWPNTQGVVSAFYLSTKKGSRHQVAEEIDWEFKRSGSYSGLQGNFYSLGEGGNEKQVNQVVGMEGFNPAYAFNKYTIEWTPEHIKMFVNDKFMFKYDMIQGSPDYVPVLPVQPMYLYMSIWKARWTGWINWGAGPLDCAIKNINMQPWNLLPSEFHT